jgi:hypothetical protein
MLLTNNATDDRKGQIRSGQAEMSVNDLNSVWIQVVRAITTTLEAQKPLSKLFLVRKPLTYRGFFSQGPETPSPMMFQTLHNSNQEKNFQFGKLFFAHHLESF